MKTFMNARIWIGLLLILVAAVARAEQRITVYAAASLTDAVGEVAALYEKQKSVKVAASYGASSALAKQIENAAPADVFISADSKWMDYLADKDRLLPASRRNLLGNQLVVVAPKGKGFSAEAKREFDFGKAFEGKLCVGEVASVPVGIYARQSLVSLGWWESVKSRLVGAQDVRAALAFVERGECAAGIVYATDAKMSEKVEVVLQFPETAHDPIVYPVAALTGSAAGALSFIEFLASPEADAIFQRYGFSVIGE